MGPLGKFAFFKGIFQGAPFRSAKRGSKSVSNGYHFSDFDYWLAGLIDGDGSLIVNNNYNKKSQMFTTVLSFELTLDRKDIKTLHYIKQTLGFGNIQARSNCKAYRIRTAAKDNIIDIVQRVNPPREARGPSGKLLTSSKQVQLKAFCHHLNITPVIPKDSDSLKIIHNTAWFSGFLMRKVILQ